jgi:hypothetical protein
MVLSDRFFFGIGVTLRVHRLDLISVKRYGASASELFERRI